jgi:hypothetical protein
MNECPCFKLLYNSVTWDMHLDMLKLIATTTNISNMIVEMKIKIGARYSGHRA